MRGDVCFLDIDEIVDHRCLNISNNIHNHTVMVCETTAITITGEVWGRMTSKCRLVMHGEKSFDVEGCE